MMLPEHPVRGLEGVLGLGCGGGVGAGGVGGEAGHEQRPAGQADHLHDGGGDADGHGGAHGPVGRQAPDADRDGGEQGRGDGHDGEPEHDGTLVLAEAGEDLAGGLLEHVGVVEHRAQDGEGGVGQDGGGQQEDGGGLAVHQDSLEVGAGAVAAGGMVDPVVAPEAIQAARTLSGWSSRCSRARALTRSWSPAMCAAARAASCRSRVVMAVDGRPVEKGRGARLEQSGCREHERLGRRGGSGQDLAGCCGVAADQLADQDVTVFWGHAGSVAGGAGAALTGG